MNNRAIVDTETGEIVSAIVMIRSKWKGESFIMVFQNAFAHIAKDKSLTLESKNVLLYLFSRLDFENYLLIPQIEIAEELDMHKQHVSRAIKLLVQKEIILEGPKVNRSRGYRLNNSFGWKGTLKNLRLVRRSEQDQLLKELREETNAENLI